MLAGLCVCAIGASVLELLFVPFYVGSVLLPVVVPAAVVGNVLLPGLGYRLMGRTLGGVLPFLSWLVPLLVLSLTPRSEGDVIVLAEQGQEWTFYGVLLLGTAAALATVNRLSAPARRAARRPPTAPGRGRLSR